MKRNNEKWGIDELNTPEEALVDLASWWGSRLVAKRDEIKATPFYSEIGGEHGLNHPFYILATRHCNNEKEKQSIERLGGVIGVPGNFSIATGRMASEQILLATGHRAEGYGRPHDGLTHVYLHPAGYQIGDLCRSYFIARDAGNLARAFSPAETMDTRAFEFQIECATQSPWETLGAELTGGNGPDLLKQELKGKLYTNFDREGFQFDLRILENKHLLAVI